MSEHTPSEPVDILLVEDNPGDVRLTTEAFRATSVEVEFHVLHDGSEVSSYFHDRDEASSHPDLILLDLNLPRVDGLTILETLRDELDYPPPPVLVLSGSASEEDIVDSYERSANAYLTKPATPDEFTSMARAIEDFWIDAAMHPPAPS